MCLFMLTLLLLVRLTEDMRSRVVCVLCVCVCVCCVCVCVCVCVMCCVCMRVVCSEVQRSWRCFFPFFFFFSKSLVFQSKMEYQCYLHHFQFRSLLPQEGHVERETIAKLLTSVLNRINKKEAAFFHEHLLGGRIILSS